MTTERKYDSYPPTASSVSEFINKVQRQIQNHGGENIHYLYRGECRRFPEYCRPSIFRKNVLSTNPYYEKSLFNTMRQNRLSNNDSYLENAIDAQHGEFPSRLLDVSYNCLTALYFAVTPYYHEDEDEYDMPSDDKKISNDGAVFLFYIDEIFSPSAENTNENYNAIINKSPKWFSENAVFQKNHKFIDHTKLNNRIVAQQGAFILFQGNDDEKIPSYMMSEIRIPCECKKSIRRELSEMFGINTASIYPEIVNASNDLVNKSKSLITEPFVWENEIRYVLANLKKELDYYVLQLPRRSSENDPEYFCKLQAIEVLIKSYRQGIFDFFVDMTAETLKLGDGYSEKFSDYADGLEEKKKKYIKMYNKIIENAEASFREIHNTELSDLYIRMEGTL